MGFAGNSAMLAQTQGRCAPVELETAACIELT